MKVRIAQQVSGTRPSLAFLDRGSRTRTVEVQFDREAASSEIESTTMYLQVESEGEDLQRPSPSPAKRPMKAEESWLGFLFVETGLLLVFQVVLGLLGKSLALIADSAHSGADVITYGLNFYVERRKSRLSNDLQLQQEVTLNIDLLGCVLSTVLLCGATTWAAQEALGRLCRSPVHLAESNEEDFQGVGPVLLLFSVVSTLANGGTLWMYRYWGAGAASSVIQVADATGITMAVTWQPPPVPPSQGGEDVFPPPPAFSFPDSDTATLLPPPPQMGMQVERPRRNRGEPQAQKASLNLRNDFSPVACADESCEPGSSCCTSPANGEKLSRVQHLSAVLHNLVHPGCTGHGGTANGSDGRTAAKEKENLNVTSAMLHLVADVLRGVTILVVAILIEVGVITDPGKADAVCALLVAGFVAMGSVELLRRALTLMCRRNSIVEDISQPINPNQQYV
ncbi:unnamed protein product [Polarella glacialis]|uniref:Cation efflux protein transmembrane domain-containing protein n=1 Tax=Polarella glacialis TaxID=89957 RepID=A0A813H7B0_POLGL|nr:unnamed protein product [Polarella glacialis]